MATATSTAQHPFSVRVPPSWFEFDIWRATRTAELARLVDTRIDAAPRLRPWRGPLLKALRDAAEQAERQGAVMCAAMTDPMGNDGVLAALLTVFVTAGDPGPGGNTAEAIAARLTATTATTKSSTWRQVQIVDLPCGPAVRVRGTERVQLGSRSLESVVMHTLVPLPGDGGVLDLVLASPQTHLANPMLDLFEAISDTVTLSSPTDSITNQPKGQ
jgi:hypothetical protein